jgi:hypothetical protein
MTGNTGFGHKLPKNLKSIVLQENYVFNNGYQEEEEDRDLNLNAGFEVLEDFDEKEV